MRSNQSGEGEMKRTFVDCMAALPGQLFYSTQIPVCLWFPTKNENDGKRPDRRRNTFFVDARKLGTLIDRVHRELPSADVTRTVSTFHAWRGDQDAGAYADVPGFRMAAPTDTIAGHVHVPTPGRSVGADDIEDDGDRFETRPHPARLEGQRAGRRRNLL